MDPTYHFGCQFLADLIVRPFLLLLLRCARAPFFFFLFLEAREGEPRAPLAGGAKQPRVPNTQHTTHNTQHTTRNSHHTTHNTQHATRNTQHTTHNTQHTTHNTQHTTRQNNDTPHNTHTCFVFHSFIHSHSLSSNHSSSHHQAMNHADFIVTSTYQEIAGEDI